MMTDDELDIEIKYEMLENPPEDPLEVPLCPDPTPFCPDPTPLCPDPTPLCPDLTPLCPDPTDDTHYQQVDSNADVADEDDDKNPINTNEQINIARNVLQACKEDIESDREASSQPIEELQHLTKQPMEYLIEVLKDEIKYNRSMEQALIDMKPIPASAQQFIRSDVREVFVDFYVKRKEIPTLTNFMTKLYAKREDGFYKDVKIRTLVKYKLIDYHYFPTLKRFLLTENPNLAYQRHLYLRQITGYRSQERSIVYVVVLKVLPHSYVALAVSSAARVIAKTICKSDLNDNNENGSNEIRIWIRCELLPVLSPSAVVVLIQAPKNVKTLLPSSKKQDVVDWLEKRDIPCDVDGPQHKSQLYQLYKIHQKKYKENGFYEDIFASAGFKVIVSIDYPTVVYLHDTWSKISKKGTVININKALQDLRSEDWMKMERKLIKDEKQMMKDDDEMGTIVDNLLQMVKNGDIKAEDFPGGCIGTKEDNFELHIDDILIV